MTNPKPEGGPRRRALRWLKHVVDFINTAGGLVAIIGASSVAAFIAYVVSHLPRLPPSYPAFAFYIVSTIAVFLVITNGLLARRASRQTDRIADMSKCGQQFELLAEKNARCDRVLFENLGGFVAEKVDEKVALTACLREVRQNISDVLEAACVIVQTLTGNPCASSVQIIVEAAPNPEDSKVRTVFRDPVSRAKRKDGSTPFRVDKNSATLAIIGHHATRFASDNLPAESGYQNPRPEYWKDYVATHVVPLHKMVNLPPDHPNHNDEQFPVNGVFAIDALRPGLADDSCYRVLQELSWRLTVMIYRLEWLQEQFRDAMAGAAQ